jgi:hypothetical protein
MRKVIIFLLLMPVFFPPAISQIEPDATNLLLAPLPDALVGSNGESIQQVTRWETSRRGELMDLFEEHVYGRIPEMDLHMIHQVKYLDMNALGGTAIMKEVEVVLSNRKDSLAFTILMFLPRDRPGPVPLFLGLNFNGNHTIHPDPAISLTGSWVPNDPALHITGNAATDESRGVKASRWPVELILARGYGLATVYSGEIDPDYDDGFRNGAHRLAAGEGDSRTPSSWGTIAAWAWGLSRALDYLETDADVDAGRVAVIGHSRLGKAALWAGARDERFAMVISNNSGCGGAALSRRPFGERVSAINEVFPHWFALKFRDYSNNEAMLPVDQHMLVSLVAPRPLYVASAAEDDWADPMGEYLSLYYGSRVYGLYGEKVMDREQLPGVDQPLWTGPLGYHIRSGHHDLTLYDWEQYLDFADQAMRPAAGTGFGNPVTMEWITDHLRSGHPRLILTPAMDSLVRGKLAAGDPIATKGLALLRLGADKILELEPLAYQKTGRRLLGVSREAVRRMTTLALIYRLVGGEEYLQRLEEELTAVCSFSDWNPAHFLDVAEMATAVSFALDWTDGFLSPGVKQLARAALVDKAIKPGLAASSQNFWIDVAHNWNPVCHGGLSLAAMTVYEDEPELASAVLQRAVEKIPLALRPYAPDGVYPEGASYWFYATAYLTATISAFESALGTDFGFTEAHGLMESAVFSAVLAAPSGEYYNYFDAGLGGFGSLEHLGLLSWFADRSGTGMDLQPLESLLDRELAGTRRAYGTRFFPVYLLDMVKTFPGEGISFTNPEVWIGGGEEPVAIFRDPDDDPEGYFLAAKGGMAGDNHGNMDAGSFIFERDGVRWSVDPGNQDYNALEQLMGLALWEMGQNSRRWTLLTKNNFGHSTLTVNGEMHRVDGRAILSGIDLRGGKKEVTFDLSEIFGESLASAKRHFIRLPEGGLRILDELAFSKDTRELTWQLMTTAAVKVDEGRIELRQGDRRLNILPDRGAPYTIRVVELSPPPLPYDKDIPGLKRIEIRWERNDFPGERAEITVDLI